MKLMTSSARLEHHVQLQMFCIARQTRMPLCTLQGYACATGPGQRVQCSYNANYKGFCISAPQQPGFRSDFASSFVPPLSELGSCADGPISPVCHHRLALRGPASSSCKQTFCFTDVVTRVCTCRTNLGTGIRRHLRSIVLSMLVSCI